MMVSELHIAELVPHGPEMTLIDRLLSHDAAQTVAVVQICEGCRFADAAGVVPSWIGIEYMAQTIAARIGAEARLKNQAPPIGFLLGTRRYNAAVPGFVPGSRLVVTVVPQFADAGFGSFRCTIEEDGLLAKAEVNTYQPSSAKLQELGLTLE